MTSVLTIGDALAEVAGDVKAPIAATADACMPNPFGKRDIYLRGSFNGWAAMDAQRFVFLCNRFELITSLSGAHSFKIGDDDWSEDADFGVMAGNPGKPCNWCSRGRTLNTGFRTRRGSY